MTDSSQTAPVTVGIPTYSRGELVLKTLARLLECNPKPAEIIVHVDASDGQLEQRLKEAFPWVRILSSPLRRGPGGGRHQCLLAASQPFFASFDDDSWPIDLAFFSRAIAHFETCPDVAVLAATIRHRGQSMPDDASMVEKTLNYTGCGHVMRVRAYRSISGYVDRPLAYGLEESDVALQLHAQNWKLLECQDLRVFHDTDLAHHRKSEVIAATIENAMLLAWLRYPIVLWPYGFLQTANVLRFMILQNRWGGIFKGLARIPLEIWKFRALRRPLPINSVWNFLCNRRRLTVFLF